MTNAELLTEDLMEDFRDGILDGTAPEIDWDIDGDEPF